MTKPQRLRLEGIAMTKDQKLFDLLTYIEWKVRDMRRTENEEYFEECFQTAYSKIEECLRLLGWED